MQRAEETMRRWRRDEDGALRNSKGIEEVGRKEEEEEEEEEKEDEEEAEDEAEEEGLEEVREGKAEGVVEGGSVLEQMSEQQRARRGKGGGGVNGARWEWRERTSEERGIVEKRALLGRYQYLTRPPSFPAV